MNNINYINWKSYYIKNSIIDYNLKNTEHIRLFNTNDFTLKNDNINHMNPYLGEMVMLYYIWKNNLKSDYIIISQYRRDFIQIDWDKIINNKVQTLYESYSNESIIEKFINFCLDPQLIIFIEKYLANKKGVSFNKIDEIFHRKNHHTFFIICFACKWEIFCDICDFIFSIYEYILPNNEWKKIYNYEKYRNQLIHKIGKTTYSVNSPRYFAFLIELILGSCLPILYDIFDNHQRTSKNIFCNINENITENQFKKFYDKNLCLQPNYNFIYEGDKITSNNKNYFKYLIKEYDIKEKHDKHVILEPWHYLFYDNIKFIDKNNQYYNIEKNDIQLSINEYIDSDSIEDFMNNQYKIKKIDNI